MAITFNPSSLTMRVGFKQTVVVTSTTPITSIAAVDARIITVAGATGSTTASVVITPVNGSYGVGKLRIGNSGGELVDLNVTVLGIDTSFVSSLIGLASSDIGTLCRGLAGTVQKINKWSKHKPVRYASIETPSEAIMKAADWGLSLPAIGWQALRTLADGMTININNGIINLTPQPVWAYLNPTGGSSQPFRIGDYRGYSQSAKQLFDPQKNYMTDIYYDPSTDKYKWDIDISEEAQVEGGLTIPDFTNGANWYLGVMVFDYAATGNPVRILVINAWKVTASKVLTIDVTGLSMSHHRVCLFLCAGITGGLNLTNVTDAYITSNLPSLNTCIAIENGILQLDITYILVQVDNNVADGTSVGVRIGWKTATSSITWTNTRSVANESSRIFKVLHIPMETEIQLYFDNDDGEDIYLFNNNAHIATIADKGYITRTPLPDGFNTLPYHYNFIAMIGGVRAYLRVIKDASVNAIMTVEIVASGFETQQVTITGVDAVLRIPWNNTFSMTVTSDAGDGYHLAHSGSEAFDDVYQVFQGRYELELELHTGDSLDAAEFAITISSEFN